MELDFYKVQACHNDFVLVNYVYRGAAPPDDVLPRLSRAVCDRRVGVGANGVVFLNRGTEHAARVSVLGPDGVPARLYNDALLCVGRVAFDSGLSGDKKIVLECHDGARNLDFIDSSHFRVAVGQPKSYPDRGDLRERPNAEYQQSIDIDGKRLSITPISLQTDAAVLFSDELGGSKVRRLSEEVRKIGLKPVFCSVYSKDEIAISASFRGGSVDFSSAAAQATVASVVDGFTERDVVVHCNRGDLYVQWTESPNDVLVTGSAEYVFSGTFYFDEDKEE